jgi:hypothetical protein
VAKEAICKKEFQRFLKEKELRDEITRLRESEKKRL